MAPGSPTDPSASIDEALAAERQWFASGNAGPLAALCLSGGGIRSATFALGVLQGLAAKGLLDRFHYLSTVSGGGYTGSWLSSWIMRDGVHGVVQALGHRAAEGEPRPVKRLRAYAHYLSPVWGLSADFLSLLSIFIRNLALHWCVVLPLLAVALLLPRLQQAILSVPAPGVQAWLADASQPPEPGMPAWAIGVTMALAVLLLLMTIAYFAADLPGDPPLERKPKNRFTLMCFFPLLLSAMLFSWAMCWGSEALTDSAAKTMGGVALLHYMGAITGMAWRLRRGLPLRPRKENKNLALDLGYIGASGAVGGLLLYAIALLTIELRTTSEGLRLLTTLCVPALLVAFWVGVTCYAGLASRITTEEDREWWARSAGWWLGAGTAWLIASVLVIYVPMLLLQLWWVQTSSGPPVLGLGAALVGIFTGAAGYWSKNGAVVTEKAKTLLQLTRVKLLDAAALLSTLALVIAMSYAMSCTLRVTQRDLAHEVHKRQADATAMAKYASAGQGSAPASAAPGALASAPGQPVPASLAARSAASYATVLDAATPLHVLGLAIALLAFGSLVSWVIGINAFSLHNMYGNRLSRAYLGASNGQRRAHWFTGFDPLDNPRLADVLREGGAQGPFRKDRCLFPVINVALNLVQASGDRLEWQQRKAASFTMTPLHCGSPVLGFAPTPLYGDDRGGMSLGRAMAISGAAASPNMGYHSSKLVAFIMTFLNVRLGWWMPNPVGRNAGLWSRREPRLGLEALYAEGIVGATEKRDFVYLSDGGHFENLGIYEMVRRRCARIVAVDSSSDPAFRYGDLQNAIQKVRIDFGIPIRFVEQLPTPERAAESHRRIAVALIDYAAVEPGAAPGWLIYVKPVLDGHEPLDVKSYAQEHDKPGSAFPHQSTADQFFDESQFESYRMLGQDIVMRDFAGQGLWPEPPGGAAQPQPTL